MTYQPIIPRARIGLMLTSENTIAEPEFHRYLPEGTESCATRVRMARPHREKRTFDDLLSEISTAARALNDAECNVIAVHCTGASMSAGQDGDTKFMETVTQATGKPATTCAVGVTAALRTLGVKRLAFIAKHDEDVKMQKVGYLTGAGFEIVSVHRAPVNNRTAPTMPTEFWYDQCMTFRDESADAYFITCTNVRALESIDRLERDLGKPVVSSNQALLWHALRTAGVRDPVPGLGKLLRISESQYVRAAA
jgi:maleate cis-trans isomerase